MQGSSAQLLLLPRFRDLPVAGCRFAKRPALMESKDSKKTIKTYNKLAQTLLEFQALWHRAWLQSVENSKAQLQATLLAEHQSTGEGAGRGSARLQCSNTGSPACHCQT